MSRPTRVVSSPSLGPNGTSEFATIEHAVTRIVGLTDSRKPSNAARALVYPLDRAAYALLTRIGECTSVRLTELASTMGIDLSTASRQVRALEERGLVARACNPDDQRTRWLNLTDEGQRALVEARAVRVEALRTRLTNWSASDIADLARLLERFIQSFETASSDPGRPRDTSDAAEEEASRSAHDVIDHALSTIGGKAK